MAFDGFFKEVTDKAGVAKGAIAVQVKLLQKSVYLGLRLWGQGEMAFGAELVENGGKFFRSVVAEVKIAVEARL